MFGMVRSFPGLIALAAVLIHHPVSARASDEISDKPSAEIVAELSYLNSLVQTVDVGPSLRGKLEHIYSAIARCEGTQPADYEEDAVAVSSLILALSGVYLEPDLSDFHLKVRVKTGCGLADNEIATMAQMLRELGFQHRVAASIATRNAVMIDRLLTESDMSSLITLTADQLVSHASK
jgi:hypothetical protein